MSEESITPESVTIGDNVPEDTTPPAADPKGVENTDEKTFYAGLNEDNRAFVEKSGYKSMDDLVKSASEAQISLSDGSKRIPGADASEEAQTAFHKAMGVPDEAKSYDLTMPEGLNENFNYSADFADQFKGMAKTANLSPQQANSVHGAYVTLADQMQVEAKAQEELALKEDMASSQKSLAEAWGTPESQAFKENSALAFKGIKGQGGEALMEEMREAGILSQDNKVLKPEIFKMFANVGKKLHSEGGQVDGVYSASNNPFSKEHFNLTAQSILKKQDPNMYASLKAAAAG